MAGYNRPNHSGSRNYRAGGARYDARRRVNRGNDPKAAFIVIGSTVLLIVLVIVVALIVRGGKKDDVQYDPASEGMPIVNVLTEGLATATPEPTSEPTATPAPTPVNYGISLPEPIEEGYLPIVRKAETNKKIIAITVDDCFQFKNTRIITDLILSNGGNFTLFPIGKNILREELYDTLHYCYNNGVQIENHTYEHRAHYNMTDDQMARQVYLNKACLDHVLGIDYQQHFFRPMGGDGRDDQRLHIYCDTLGFRAIAYWSVSGSDLPVEEIKESLAPGQIYLFHTTDSDLVKLQEFVPYAVAEGYTLVTLNEMYGLPDNEVKPLDGPVTDRELPLIGDYSMNPRTYRIKSFAWGTYLIQERLIELDYLKGAPDGVYGEDTAKAVKKFQNDNKLNATGECDPQTQAVLFRDDPETLELLQGGKGYIGPKTTAAPESAAADASAEADAASAPEE